MPREIVLDTETTGLDPYSGHRLIEIACVELEDSIPTGRSFYRLMDPEREIDAEAERVHGISTAAVRGKPRFADPEIVEAFLEFVADAQLIAHNAGFDRGFINAELDRANRPALPEARWIDTLSMAQKRFPGMYNSLDALCKRFRISLAEREKHGALIDAKLLAGVYLELQGGRERRLDLGMAVSGARSAVGAAPPTVNYGPRPRPLAPLSTASERAAHLSFIAKALKGEIVWLKFGLELELG